MLIYYELMPIPHHHHVSNAVHFGSQTLDPTIVQNIPPCIIRFDFPDAATH